MRDIQNTLKTLVALRRLAARKHVESEELNETVEAKEYQVKREYEAILTDYLAAECEDTRYEDVVIITSPSFTDLGEMIIRLAIQGNAQTHTIDPKYMVDPEDRVGE